MTGTILEMLDQRLREGVVGVIEQGDKYFVSNEPVRFQLIIFVQAHDHPEAIKFKNTLDLN